MRAEDQTLVDYVIGWGMSQSKDPYISDFQTSAWEPILELEGSGRRSRATPDLRDRGRRAA